MSIRCKVFPIQFGLGFNIMETCKLFFIKIYLVFFLDEYQFFVYSIHTYTY